WAGVWGPGPARGGRPLPPSALASMSDAVDKGSSEGERRAKPGEPALRDLVDYLARGLVDHPEEVEVEEISEPDALVFELKVAEQDLGKVIGKQGRTAK